VGEHSHFTALWILSGITLASRYQKGKTNLDFTEARDSDWWWHQLGHVQICISPQTFFILRLYKILKGINGDVLFKKWWLSTLLDF